MLTTELSPVLKLLDPVIKLEMAAMPAAVAVKPAEYCLYARTAAMMPGRRRWSRRCNNKSLDEKATTVTSIEPICRQGCQMLRHTAFLIV